MDDARPVLFTRTGCADSRKVAGWLAARGVAFVERDVTGDDVAARALLATGRFGTPLLVVGETAVIGFRPAVLAAALGIAGDER